MKFLTTLCIVLALSLPCLGQAKATSVKPPPQGVNIQRDITYATVDGKELKLDLYLPDTPATDKPPLIVWIHGGAWGQGNKNNNGLLVWAAAEGFAMASIQYRLSGDAKFPAQVHDAKGAIRWLRAHADEYGYDPRNITVAGGSAGGHLAALVGVSGGVESLEGNVGGNLDQSSRVQGIVDFYGPTDLYFNATQERDRVDDPVGPLWQFLGSKPSETLDQAKLASPVHHVTPDDPPMLILHGTQDPQVHLRHSEFLRDAYAKAGLPVTLVIIEGAGHGGAPFTDAERKQLILQFLRRHAASR